MGKRKTQSVTTQQVRTLMFFQRMEAQGKSFTIEEFAKSSGYPLGPSLKAKLSRGEFGEFLCDMGGGMYMAQNTSGLTPKEYARRVSSSYRLSQYNTIGSKGGSTLSSNLVDKSTHAAIAAIEIYNKPDFKYREEAFAILMVNAWELLLKAKVAEDNDNLPEVLYQKAKDGSGNMVNVTSRSGNPRTISIGDAIKQVNLDPVLKDHLFVLIEIRDNAVHLLDDSPLLRHKVQEVGTATLRSYLNTTKEWFDTDLTKYNFYLMPMSFFHTQEMESYSITKEPEQHQNLLRFIHAQEEKHASEAIGPHSITLELRTEFVKSKMKYSPDDPNAIPMKVDAEESFQKKYRWNYTDHLLPKLTERYKDFKVDKKFLALKKELETNDAYSKVRPLDWTKPKGQTKRFYSPDIVKEFDKHYTKA